jgi:RIO-like serine/threonine protein kinase
MMAEYCTCGIPKEHHITFEDLLGTHVTTADEAYAYAAAKAAKMAMMFTNYGHKCFKYQRDNLRYVEDLEKARNVHVDTQSSRQA